MFEGPNAAIAVPVIVTLIIQAGALVWFLATFRTEFKALSERVLRIETNLKNFVKTDQGVLERLITLESKVNQISSRLDHIERQIDHQH